RTGQAGIRLSRKRLVLFQEALLQHVEIAHALVHQASLAPEAPGVGGADQEIEQQSDDPFGGLLAQGAVLLEGADEGFAERNVDADRVEELFLDAAVKLAGFLKDD